MTNLIPPNARKQVKREYWIRAISVWFFLLGFACITIAILNAPVYVLVKNQLSSYQSEYNEASSTMQSFELFEKDIKDALTVGKLLIAVEADESLTSVIEELDTLAGEGIDITHYALSRVDGKINTITLSGEAVSRVSLSDFRTRLETTPKFATAKLPLSNLAKDKDIPFSITIAKESDESKKSSAPKP
jgi:Tfp pilus assembly protein PilN